MKAQNIKPTKEPMRHNQAEQNAATSGFIREAINESRSIVKEITRDKHSHTPSASSILAKKHQYSNKF